MKAALSLSLVLAGALLLSACGTTKQTESAVVAPPPPAPTAPASLAAAGDRVWFDLDRYDLTEGSKATLTRQAEWMRANPQAAVRIEGHADERGTRDYNLALGNRRAVSARDFLLGQGIEPNRVTTISYGRERPECAQSVEACWSKNRRAVSIEVTQGS